MRSLLSHGLRAECCLLGPRGGSLSHRSSLGGRAPALQALCPSYASLGVSSGHFTSGRRGTPSTSLHGTVSIPAPPVLSISPVVPQKASDLVDMINRVIREGLEGLVLKDAKVRPARPFQPWPGGGSVVWGPGRVPCSGSRQWVAVCLLWGPGPKGSPWSDPGTGEGPVCRVKR